MNTKTVHLSGELYSLRMGKVMVLSGPTDNLGTWEWQETRHKVGNLAVLVSAEDVSPNSVRTGAAKPVYRLRFDCENGIPGNSNREICRLHGWRGTTNNIAITAHGLRKITKIRELKNGDIAVTVGPDLKPEKP